MGILDEIDKLELSDDQKDRLREQAQQELGNKDDELTRLRRRNKKTEVESEIADLKALFGDEPMAQAPGLLKFVRRVYLSDDEKPGSVLLSDADLELSADEASGARTEEEISVAEGIREFIRLMPRNKEGKLIVMLSDQAHAHQDHGGPASEEEESDQDRADKRGRVEKTLGRPVERKRTRFKGTVS